MSKEDAKERYRKGFITYDEYLREITEIDRGCSRVDLVSSIHYGGLAYARRVYLEKLNELEYELKRGIISHEEFVLKYKELKKNHENDIKSSNERYMRALDDC